MRPELDTGYWILDTRRESRIENRRIELRLTYLAQTGGSLKRSPLGTPYGGNTPQMGPFRHLPDFRPVVGQHEPG
jgi:hypothetical protein